MRLLNRISPECRRYPLRCLSWESGGSSPPSAVADNNVISAWMGVRRALRRWTLRTVLWWAFNLRGGKAYIFPRSLLFVKGSYLTCIWTLRGTRMSFQAFDSLPEIYSSFVWTSRALEMNNPTRGLQKCSLQRRACSENTNSTHR